MNQRDKDILASLKKFRALSRDHIISLHFKDLKENVNSCNRVLKRLQRDGLVDRDPTRRPYIYYPNPSSIKKNSSKLTHFHSIADFYIEALEYGKISEFEVEPKLGKKGTVEPDLYMVWNGQPFFVEIQLSYYSKKQIREKVERYKKYYRSREWEELNQVFPGVMIIDERVHDLEDVQFKVFQAKNMEELKKKYGKKKTLPQPVKASSSGGLQVKIK